MKKLFLTSLICIGCLSDIFAIEVSFTGSSERILNIVPEKSTGLDKIFIAYDSSEISQIRINAFSSSLSVSRYSNLGGGYAEELTVNYDGETAIINNPSGDMGYILSDNTSTYAFWLVNYSSHKFTLNSVNASSMQSCDNTIIDIDGTGNAIYYYSINGRQNELSRDISVKYHNLIWNEQSENFIQEPQTKVLNHLTASVAITPPLYCNSTFMISGDRFLEEWGRPVIIESEIVYANGVNANTSATQINIPDEETGSNIIHTETQGMGGSAPVDIEFRAHTTDAVIHNEWQIAADQDFEYIDYRFNEQNLDYTFNEEGTYFVRFIGSNADGSCEIIGDTYTVGVGSSELRIPNAFTPNNDGVNDEWKVSYRSLLSFNCTIFDRYGNELFHFNDPTLGWDGKYKGKYVQPGVYFYVIEAVGADGKKYKKGGDINIIKSKKYNSNSNNVE